MPKNADFPPKLMRLEMILWKGMALYGEGVLCDR